jgi:iron complex transport system ATP-binding protein
MNVFTARAVSVRYHGATQLALHDVDANIARARFTAIIGPNGSGKSTLIRALLGAVPVQSGEVSFEERAVASYTRTELARRVAAVTQSEEMPFPVTVRELVTTGRFAHLGAWRAEGEADRSAVQRALERCDIAHLADRSIARVSGGERQRARVARALAQEPATLVLDEPTASLDVAHEMAVFELLRSLVDQEARSILIATHNINLAARYADVMVLMAEGRAARRGAPRDVMQKDVLEHVYQWPLRIYDLDGAPQVAPLSRT